MERRDLEWNLGFTYHLLAKGFSEAGVTLTDHILEDRLPGLVFLQALNSEPVWIPEPPDARGLNDGERVVESGRAQLGEWEVSERFRRDFLDMLPIAFYKKNTNGRSASNPRKLIEEFKDLSGDSWTDEAISAEIGVHPQTLVRIRSGTQGHPANLNKLAKLMKREFPKEYRDLHWMHLRWPRKTGV